MEHIVVTEELKNKVIERIEEREKQQKRKSLRPAYVTLVAASVLLAVSLYPTKPAKEKRQKKRK